MPDAIPATTHSDIDAAISALRNSKSKFAELSVTDRISLLDDCTQALIGVTEVWVETACQAKQIPLDSQTASEEWLGGPMVTHRNIRLLREALSQIEEHGRTLVPKNSMRTTCSGQTAVRVFPADGYDKLFFMGFEGEIWMEPGVNPDNITEGMAWAYQDNASKEGAVSLVLGAGNVASIGPMDVLYKLFVENEVCILKMNPVNEYLGPFIEKTFASIIAQDYMRVVYGGAEVGDYLCKHDGIDNIHITGSDKTHDIIVWGPPGPEREQRMAKGEPVNTKPISSELGNVSPVIIVPGPWKPGDLKFHAENIASMVTNNGSFNCNAAKLVVQHEGWDLRNSLMDNVESVLSSAHQRIAYYPGAFNRYDTFVGTHTEAKALGEKTDKIIPWTVIRNVDSSNTDDICFTTEAFCGVLSETSLPAESTLEYIKKAVAFCNEQVWGTLSATIIVHPKSLKDPAIKAAVDQAVADLKYGTVAVNHWPALAYAFGTTTWGAFPGHTLDDIQSGRGVVHNSLMFDKPQKTVVRGPFKVAPTPPWFISHGGPLKLAKRLTAFEAAPSWLKIPGIIVSSLG